MEVCNVCKREMLLAKGCSVSKIHVDEKVHKRILVGNPGNFYELADHEAHCSDCGAQFGHFHHWGCDCERCPACGRQLLSCECEDVYVSEPASQISASAPDKGGHM